MLKKKYLFIFLTIILISLIIYISIFLFIFFNINFFLKYDYLSSKEEIYLYKKYSNIVHHLREPYIYSKKKNKNFSKYILTDISRNDLKETILLQGDSWFEQIDEYKKATVAIKNKINRNFNVVNAGTMSYSPSLMSMQYRMLKENFNVKPDYIITYIDQTDILDENCRYKELKKYDKNKNLISVPYEIYPYYNGLGIDLAIKHSEISLQKNNFLKTYFYTKYKITKSYYKIKKSFQKKLAKKSFSGKCKLSDLEKMLINKDKEAINYFSSSLVEYLTRLTEEKKIKKIFIITHPHKINLENHNLLNVSNLIDDLIKDNSKIEHINFTQKFLKNPTLYAKFNNIWLKDQIHLNEEAFSEVFIPEVFDYVLKKINY